MKKIYFLFLLFIFSVPFYCHSQIQILTPNDTTLCNGAPATLRAVVLGRTGTTISLSVDDDYSGVVPIGFPFQFYGITYTTCVISSNGFISFNTANANGSSPWQLGGSTGSPVPGGPGRIPGNQNCLNSLCGAYSDIYPVLGGTIDYSTIGIAPNRRFVVSFCTVPMYSCNSQFITFQMILDETSNICEVHIGHKDTCIAWDGGYAIEGVQNAAGNTATVAPGRNDSVVWVANHDAYEFVPTTILGNPTYTVSSIPYAPVPGAGAPLYWYQDTTYLGTGPSITVTPSATTTYSIKAVDCGDTLTNTITSSVGAVRIRVSTPPVVNFSDVVNYGCSQDTVMFTNLSSGASAYRWNFGTNTAIDTNTNPTSIFYLHDTISVKLIGTSALGCIDSSVKSIDLSHPLKAAFTVSKDSICQYTTVVFTNTSTYTTQKGNPSYYWNFGDGSTDTVASPTHVYTRAGNFRVIMGIRNFIPCFDTAYAIIHVDTITYISVTQSDSALCQGSAVTFHGVYSTLGNVGTVWDFGDGTIINNRNDISHAFATAGNYTITFTANYRVCPDTTFPKHVTVFGYPELNLGPDTSLCPGSAGITINDFVNAGNPKASWMWSTGDTSSGISVSQPGIYYTTVNVNGCSTSDSVLIKNDCYVNIPNVFTPNNDGVNDFFFPRLVLSSSTTKFDMTVYNRWGQEIFYTQATNGRGWDGKLSGNDVPTGVYIYIINVSFADGTSEHHQGNVTLLR